MIKNIVEDLKSSKARFLAEGPEGTVLLHADAESPLCSSLRSVQLLSTPGGHQVSAIIVFNTFIFLVYRFFCLKIDFLCVKFF